MEMCDKNRAGAVSSICGNFITKLELKDLLRTEFFLTNWSPLIDCQDFQKHKYFCNVCRVVQYGINNLYSHLSGKKHTSSMTKVKQIYNPAYTKVEHNKNSKVFSDTLQDKRYDNNDKVGLFPIGSVNKELEQANRKLVDSKLDTKSTIPMEKEKHTNYILDRETDSIIVSSDQLINPEKHSNKAMHSLNDIVELTSNSTSSTDEKINKSSLNKTESSSAKSNEENISRCEKTQTKNKSILINPIAVLNSRKRKKKDQASNSVHNYKLLFETNNLDNYQKLGFLGVEYVIQICKNKDDNNPKYECSLCELVLTAYVMQRHLLGYNHRLKFCEKHFPTAIRHYRLYMSKVPEHEVFKVMTPILQMLAVAIETHHGKDLPYKCYERDLNLNRHYILSKVYASRHACEQHGPTFTHAIDAKQIDYLIENRNKLRQSSNTQEPIQQMDQSDSIDTNENANLTRTYDSIYSQKKECKNIEKRHQSINHKNTVELDDATHRLMVEDFINRNNRVYNRSDYRNESDFSLPKRRRPDSEYDFWPNHSERRSVSPLRDGDIWQAYRHMVDQEITKLNQLYKVYRADPEQHPLYNQEWQQFWKRRKEELIISRIDHRNYNYQNEWSLYFKVRIEELYNQKIEYIKIESRERLCLPMTNFDLEDSAYHVHVAQDEEYSNYEGDMELKSNEYECEDEYMNSNSTNIIHVLRILTALEEHIGSFGPKITQLLTKALVIDKNTPGKTNIILNTPENCKVLEAAKEKLKDTLCTEVVNTLKQRAIEKAILNTENYLRFASQNVANITNWRHELINFTKKTKRTTQNSLQMFGDRNPKCYVTKCLENNDLSAVLASSLKDQGNTDCNSDELKRIIQIFNLFEKNKKDIRYTRSTTPTNNLSYNSSSSSLQHSQIGYYRNANNNSSQILNTLSNINSWESRRPTRDLSSYKKGNNNPYFDDQRYSNDVNASQFFADGRSRFTDDCVWNN